MNDPNSTVILTQLWNSETTCRTNGPSATYSRIPSLDDVICGNSSGFRLRCRRNRFLFMTEYRADGRSSFGFSWSLVLSLLSFSLFLFSYLTTSVLACSIAETCRFFRETQHREQEEGGIELEPEGNTMKTKRFFLYFSFEVDRLGRIRVKRLVA